MPNLHKSFYGDSAISTAGLALILRVVVIFHPQGDSDGPTRRLSLANVSGCFRQNHLRGSVNQMRNQAVIAWWWIFNPLVDNTVQTLGVYCDHAWAELVQQLRLWFALGAGKWHWFDALCVIRQHSDPSALKQRSLSLNCHFLSLSTRRNFVPHKAMPQISSAEGSVVRAVRILSQELENRPLNYGLGEWRGEKFWVHTLWGFLPSNLLPRKRSHREWNASGMLPASDPT